MGVPFDALVDLLDKFCRILHLVNIYFMDLVDPLYQACQIYFLSQGQRQSSIVVAACTPHTMQIDVKVNVSLFLWVFRRPHVNNKTSISDINTSCDDICCAQNVSFVISKFGHYLSFLFYRHLNFLAVFVFLCSYYADCQRFEVLRLVWGEIWSLSKIKSTLALKY